ncbi:ATP synthase F1 subunit gamma [Crocinitomix catalasitica]|nr:ATP synthase F1 subunit gamma [Crocinitomix catalasitica]
MANLKEIRNRITSVSSTMQITSAMKMVSASKLKRAQDAVVKMRPYANKLTEILGNLSSSLSDSDNVFASNRADQNIVIVVVTSNRGLCGGFNNYIIKQAFRLIEEDYKGKDVSIVCIGKKATDAFKRTEYYISGSHLPSHLDDLWNELSFENSAPYIEKIMKAYIDKQIDKVVLVYNHFKSVASQQIKVEQFLPIAPPDEEEIEGQEQKPKTNTDYIYEPSQEQIVSELMPKSLKVQFYSALLDSFAGEHAARMTAMHKATDNASELIKELKLEYNKARQAAITNEILEIVGGAEALKG